VKPHHARIDDSVFRRAVEFLDNGDATALREHLRKHPQLVQQRVTFEGENYFTRPSLLEFIAENPVRHDRLPPNIVEVAEVILAAGAPQTAVDSTLALVSSGRVARACGVQRALIELLCARGAAVDEAMLPALVHGEFEAVDALLQCGAALNITAAAALGRIEDVRRMFAAADSLSRHRALALAAQHGHAEIVALLIEAGEDPNRYNPAGCHAHSTPLHQAALAGQLEVVKTLIDHGAQTDMRDTLFDGTALDWAAHGKNDQIVAYLRRV
jgi:peptide-methionine (S)-S-oxide reductase